jgi:hypothetical protein
MSDVLRRHTVMIAQIPLPLILYDRVMSGPTYYRVEYHTLITEWSVRRVTNGIAEIMTVTCRVREIVLTIILMHPRCLEEAMGIASLHGLTVLIENHHATRCFSKLLNIVAHTNHTAVDGW